MIFKAPKSKYIYFFGQSMFETIWNIFLFLAIFFFAMSIKHFITGNPNTFTFVGALVMSLVSLLILKRTGRYRTAGVVGYCFRFCILYV